MSKCLFAFYIKGKARETLVTCSMRAGQGICKVNKHVVGAQKKKDEIGHNHSPIMGAKVFTKGLPDISSSQNLCLFLWLCES